MTDGSKPNNDNAGCYDAMKCATMRCRWLLGAGGCRVAFAMMRGCRVHAVRADCRPVRM